LAFFVLLSVGLMVADHRTRSLGPVRSLLSTLVYPFQAAVTLPVEGVGGLLEGFRERRALSDENARLRAEQMVLKAQLQKYSALESENRHLRELLDSSFRIGERLLVAELLSVDADPFSRHITIERGSLHDVFKGQPLLDADGVVGQIRHVSPLTSTAILITDPSHALPVSIVRNGLRAVALGTGSSNRLELPFIPNSEDVRVGDRVVTSGLGGRFPAGYPVGTVVEVNHDPREPFAGIGVEPSAHPERSSQFLLVWPAKEAVLGSQEGDAGTAPRDGERAPERQQADPVEDAGHG
jgi:rod shape-determining protein MreC